MSGNTACGDAALDYSPKSNIEHRTLNIERRTLNSQLPGGESARPVRGRLGEVGWAGEGEVHGKLRVPFGPAQDLFTSRRGAPFPFLSRPRRLCQCVCEGR